MKHVLPELPYSFDALEPHLSRETIEFHYGKHHQAYVNNLNNMVPGTEFDNLSLEDVIMKASAGGVYNNAAQIWNHSFYWEGLTPDSSKIPEGTIAQLIEQVYGSFDEFKAKFSIAAATNFGSGWTWLVKGNRGDLEIFNTDDADTAMKHGKTPLLTIDVWEHAYYIDYRNARPKYIEAFWNLVNWDFVSKNLG
ncbi:MAG: superoxide dismutase [Candidatus Neomarinimicrobiota bacterium]